MFHLLTPKLSESISPRGCDVRSTTHRAFLKLRFILLTTEVAVEPGGGVLFFTRGICFFSVEAGVFSRVVCLGS